MGSGEGMPFQWRKPWLAHGGKVWVYVGYGHFELMDADEERVAGALDRLKSMGEQALKSEEWRLGMFLLRERRKEEKAMQPTNKVVKAISLWQPWASLCVLGLKQYETRHWQTDFRGTLVIHAAKRPLTANEHDMLTDWECGDGFIDAQFHQEITRDSRLFGAALGTVELKAIYRTKLLLPKISKQEAAFGDYSDGRYAWQLENPRLFAEPIPYRGQQGMWTWDIPLPDEIYARAEIVR